MPKLKTAIVDIPKHAQIGNFHGMTALNANLKLKWFTDIEAAKSRLKEN